jgi:hypothetical protein
MARSSFTTRNSQPSVFSSLLGPVVLVAAAGLVGWLLLETVKWLIVTLLIAVGVALVVVPFFAGRRILGASVGPDRRHRQVQLATALLIVVPAAVILLGRLFGRIGSRSRGAGALR